MSPPLVYHPDYSVPLPEGHRFPMAKFRLLLEVLLRQGLTRPERIHRPLPAPRRWLERVHARRYHEAVSRGTLTPAEVRRLGLPPSPALVRRSWLAEPTTPSRITAVASASSTTAPSPRWSCCPKGG